MIEGVGSFLRWSVFLVISIPLGLAATILTGFTLLVVGCAFVVLYGAHYLLIGPSTEES